MCKKRKDERDVVAVHGVWSDFEGDKTSIIENDR